MVRSLLFLLAALALGPLAPAPALSAETAARAEEARMLYVFLYRPGPEYRPGRPLAEQGLAPHGAYIKSLLDAGRLFAAGPYAGADGGVALVWAETVEEAQAILAADPAIRDRIFEAEIRAWTPRFVSGETLAAAR